MKEKRLTKERGAVILSILLLIALLISYLPAREKDFYFPLLKADLFIQKDGSFLVDEYLTFEFQGDFSWASLWLPLEARKGVSRSSQIEISDFRVVDETGQILPAETRINDGRFEARWHFRAADERRTFHLSYRVKGAILNYADVSELYWQIIGSEVDRPTERAEILVHLPEAVNQTEELLVYGHGPLSGKSEILDARTVRFQASSIPAHQFLEIRVVWPAGLVAGVPASGLAREIIMKEEEKLVQETIEKARQAREADQKQQEIFHRLAVGWAGWQVLGPLLWLLFYFYFWKKVGEDYQFDDIPEYYREIPSNLPPALVQVLRKQGGKPDPVALTATIFDLARRGYLEITEEKIEEKGLFGHKIKNQVVFNFKNEPQIGDKLKPFEQEILKLLARAAGKETLDKGGRLRLEDFVDYLKSSAAKLQWFEGWAKSLTVEAKKLGFIEPASQRTWQIFLLVSLPLAFLTLSPVLIVMVWLLSPTLKRRRRDWARENELWEALERFLRDFSDFKEIPPEAYKLWDQYLVFGILFGQAKKLIKLIPQILADERAVKPAWLGGYLALSASRPDINSISRAISSIDRTAVAINQASLSAAHYSSGHGGGFSGGAGGGGGGGGVSAG
ncbi:MAG TPA: DUF2207 domain-containing protein [Candidatus Saccharicenans sp.]|jgi:uncharacterized membrane protein|nr:DUF2207 domain-containing protein [Candidatus Saccharicenans sp.]